MEGCPVYWSICLKISQPAQSTKPCLKLCSLAFARGINQGLPESKTYKPAAFKAWKALSALVDERYF